MRHKSERRLYAARRSARGVLAALSGLAAAVALLALPASARAEEGSASAHDEHEEEGRNVLSLKLAGLEIIAPGEAEPGGPVMDESDESEEASEDRVLRRAGVAIGYERVLIPGWLNAELSVLLAPGEGGLTLPIDLLLKKPFAISPELEILAGLGLATEWLEAGEAESAVGLSSQLELEYWFGPRLGLVLEAEYNLLLRPETEHEIVVASGGAFRF